MTIPVKLSDTLAGAAQIEANIAGRSMTKQIEHWAQIGRIVESVLRIPQLHAIKRAGTDPRQVIADAQAREAIDVLIDELAGGDRARAIRHIRGTSRPVYAAARGKPGYVTQVQPDGSRRLGRIVRGEFVPASRRR